MRDDEDGFVVVADDEDDEEEEVVSADDLPVVAMKEDDCLASMDYFVVDDGNFGGEREACFEKWGEQKVESTRCVVVVVGNTSDILPPHPLLPPLHLHLN